MFKRISSNFRRVPWNKGKLIGQKAQLSLQEFWSIRFRLQNIGDHRDLALFNLAIDAGTRREPGQGDMWVVQADGAVAGRARSFVHCSIVFNDIRS